MTASTPNSRNAPSALIGLPMRRGRARAGSLAWIVLALVLGTAGCKSSKGGSANGVASTDPLMSNNRIPPTSVPIPDRGTGLGSRTKGNDPLLGSPTAGSKDKRGATRTEDSDRWKGPYIPSEAATNAALTSRLRNDHSDLSLDEKPVDTSRGARLQLAAATVPVSVSAGTSIGSDQVPKVLQDDLKALGIDNGGYELVKTPSGEFAVRAQVPNKTNGLTRYEEVGPTAAAAVQRLVDQIKSDR